MKNMSIMNKIAKIILLAVGLIQLTSCGTKTVFDETHPISGVWNRFKPDTFMVDINDADELYDMYLSVAVDTARYHANTLPIHVNVVSELGERRMFPCGITLRDNHDVWKGEWRDGLLVVDQRVRDCFSFNRKGRHTVTVGQATHYYDIDGVRSLRLHLSPTEIVYPD